MVNGEAVECSPEDEAEILSEWEANDAKAAEQIQIDEKETKRLSAIRANEDYLIAQTAKQPDAPQEVKDYVNKTKTDERL